MRIYVAASWAFITHTKSVKKQFQNAGFEVVSTWTEQEDTADAQTLSENAQRDMDELESADAFVIFNWAKSEGKATEMGWALAAGKIVVLVGSTDGNFFYHLPQVHQTENIAEAIEYLRDMECEATVGNYPEPGGFSEVDYTEPAEVPGTRLQVEAWQEQEELLEAVIDDVLDENKALRDVAMGALERLADLQADLLHALRLPLSAIR